MPSLNHLQDRATEPHTVDDIQHLLLGFLQIEETAGAGTATGVALRLSPDPRAVYCPEQLGIMILRMPPSGS